MHPLRQKGTSSCLSLLESPGSLSWIRDTFGHSNIITVEIRRELKNIIMLILNLSVKCTSISQWNTYRFEGTLLKLPYLSPRLP